VDKSHITKQEPEKALLEPKKRTGGRNNHGEIVIWTAVAATRNNIVRWISGATSWACLPRSQRLNTIPIAVRNLALLHYADGEKRYILHPVGLEVGATVSTGEGADILPAMRCSSSIFHRARWCTTWSFYPGRGGQVVRSAGGSAQLLSKEGDLALVKLPSGEVRKFSIECMATSARLAISITKNETFGKAGRTRMARY